MPDDRPVSMGQALDDAGFDSGPDSSTVETAEPITQTPDASSASTDSSTTLSDAASTAAPPTEAPQTAEPPPGPIPYDRHKAILEKSRADHAAEMAAVSWAKQVPAEIANDVVEILQRVNGDPVGFAVELVSRAQNDPRHAASIKSHAARLLATRTPAAAPAPAPRVSLPDSARSGVPEVDAVLDARDRYIIEQLAEQFGGVVEERVAPLSSLAKRVADAEAAQEASRTAQEFATREFKAVEKLPGFLDHREQIADAFAAEMAKLPESQQDARAAVVLRDVYHAIVLPTLTKASADTVRQTLTAKAVAGSLGARPTSAGSVSRPRSMAEALEQAGV